MTLALTAAASAFAVVGNVDDARACGGCFTPPSQVASDITDERMLLTVSTTQTTLYDQIRYQGSPASFAWVLPIHGTVDVGLSADVLFDSIDAVSATTIQQPAANCPSPPTSCFENQAVGFSASPSAGGADTAGGSVTVLKAANVGPYETVQLKATDPGALNNWLATNGFQIPAAVTPVLDEYVKEGFDFLAMKLLPAQGIQSMRPIRVTSQGASLSLPLRMAAIGTGTTVGITLWIVSEGRYQPQNFPFFHIDDSALVWDFSVGASNYTTLRAQHESELGGKGWEIESSIDLSEQLISNVITSGGQYYGNGGFSGAPAADAGEDYLPVTSGGAASSDGGLGDDASAGTGTTTESADQARQDDINTLFAGLTGPTVRVTRIRSDIAHAAMTVDLVVEASPDQTELSNVRVVSQQINTVCPIYDTSCTQVGTGTPAQSQASIAKINDQPGGGCVTAAATQGRERTDSGVKLGALLGAVGLIALRIRRRRSR